MTTPKYDRLVKLVGRVLVLAHMNHGGPPRLVPRKERK